LNVRIGKRNVDITDAQLKKISEYITGCYACEIKAGWRLERQSIGMFMSLAQNPEALYKKYFEY